MNGTSFAALEIAALEEFVIVGGCGGLLFVPAAQEADYYRAQRCVALIGFACLAAFFSVQPFF